MLQQQVNHIKTVWMFFDALCALVASYGAFVVTFYKADGLWAIDTDLLVGSIIIIIFINNYMMGKFGLYGDRRPDSYLALLWPILKSNIVSFSVLAIGIFIFQRKEYSRFFFLSFFLLCLVLILIYRILFQLYLDKIGRRNSYSRKILVVGNQARGRYVIDLLKSQMSWGHEVVGLLNVTGKGGRECEETLSCQELEKILRTKTVDEIIFALDGDSSVPLSQYIVMCKKVGLSFRILPSLWNPNEKLLSTEIFQGVPFLTFRSTQFNATGLLYKRMLDVVGGAAGTIFFLVIYPIVAIAIKIDSTGPVIFSQKRVGKHGRIFHIYKFRTMYQDAEKRINELKDRNEMNGAMFKLRDDPRITRIGNYLRKTSIDEVPQFWNVLKGEMSLVGTRPPTLDEVEEYKSEHLKRIAAKPGITGLWQVSGRNKITNFETVVQLDFAYMENWRFTKDLKILLKTIWIVLKRKGSL